MALTIISALVDLGTEEGCQLPRCKILTNLGGGISAAGFCNNQQELRVIWYANYDEVKVLMLLLVHGSCTRTDEEHTGRDLKSVLR